MSSSCWSEINSAPCCLWGLILNPKKSRGWGKLWGKSACCCCDQGYAPLNSPDWIANLRPQLLLLSVAADNRECHPDRETMGALGGYSLLRTDQHGWIQIATDGEQMWVAVEK